MENGRLLIKHAVGGRTFVDSIKETVAFSIRDEDGEWKFTVRLVPGETVEEIRKWRNELNVFLFEEHLEPVRKHWFYVQPDSVQYDRDAGLLQFAAGNHLQYIPDEYTW